MNWRANSPETHPPCQVPCMIRTRDGRELKAELIHLNERYHSKLPKNKMYQWKVGKHDFIEQDEVVEWRFDLDI